VQEYRDVIFYIEIRGGIYHAYEEGIYLESKGKKTLEIPSVLDAIEADLTRLASK
jgi:hypothetical protein